LGLNNAQLEIPNRIKSNKNVILRVAIAKTLYLKILSQ